MTKDCEIHSANHKQNNEFTQKTSSWKSLVYISVSFNSLKTFGQRFNCNNTKNYKTLRNSSNVLERKQERKINFQVELELLRNLLTPAGICLLRKLPYQ